VAEKLIHVLRLYVGLSAWQDLPDGECYVVGLRCVMQTDDYSDVGKREETLEAVDEFLSAIGQCPGIEAPEDAQGVLVPDNEMTLYEARRMRRWQRFDFISFDDPGHSREDRPD
jgi:hypothetical protein